MKVKFYIVKFVYSIIGFFKSLRFKKGYKYMGGINRNANSVYRGKRTFYESRELSLDNTFDACIKTAEKYIKNNKENKPKHGGIPSIR